MNRLFSSTVLLVMACGSMLGCGEESEPDRAAVLESCAQEHECPDGSMYLVESLNVASAVTDGVVAGFNLKEDDAEDMELCRKREFVSPDGETGVDNQFGNIFGLLPIQVREILPATVQSSIHDGGLLLLFESVDLGGGEYGAVFRRGAGIPHLGTDGSMLAYQTIELDPTPLQGYVAGVNIRQGEIEGGPFNLDFRMRFIAQELGAMLRRTKFRFVEQDDGSLHGLLGGVITIEDILQLVNLLGGDDEELRDVLAAMLPLFVDIRSEPDGDCDSISMAFELRAVPAFTFAPE